MIETKVAPEFGVGLEIRHDGMAGEPSIRREVVTEDYAQARAVAQFACRMYNALGYHVRYLCFNSGWIDDKGASFATGENVLPFVELPDLKTILEAS